MFKDRKHLVILTPGFCERENDSHSVVFLQNLIRALNIDFPKLRITIIAFQYPFTKKTFEWNGNAVTSLGGRSSKLKRMLIWHRARKEMEKILAQGTISAILCCWLTECSLVGEKFARKHKIPLLCWATGQDSLPGNRYLRLLKLRSKEIAVMAPHQKELLQKSGIACDLIIENGILPSSARTGSYFDIHIIGVGSLSTLKNYVEFIEIIELIKKEFPEVKCEIVGEGPQREFLQDLIRQKKLEENILLIGSIPHDKVLQKMGRSLIFLHPSTYEGNSTVILEAAYYGNFILCKKETAAYHSDLIHTYTGIFSAASTMVTILKTNKIKPTSQLLSSMQESATKLVKHLDLD